MKISRVDATQGSLVRSIFIYAIPLFLTTLLQQLFNAVDLAVLGNMANTTAVASVGATGQITGLMLQFFVGLASAVKIILARQIGARDREGAERTVGMSLILPVAFGLLVALVGVIMAPTFLTWTNCPTDCIDGAVVYLRLYIVAAPAILLYNFGSSVLTASGDTQRPLYYMAACGLLNVVLNIVLCLILPEKVAAVAIATASSQVLGAALVWLRIFRMDGICKATWSRIRWNTQALQSILRFGIPLVISNILYPVCNLMIQTNINAIGVSAIAANSAATTLETLVTGFNGAFASTVTAFMGQNIGAQKLDRVKKSFFYCLTFGFLLTFAFSTFFYLTGDFWLGFILTDDAQAYEYAYIRMQCVLMIYAVGTINSCCSHAIQAFGYPLYGSVTSIVCVFGFRTVWMQWVYPYFAPSFFHLMICYTLSWGLLFLFSTIGFAVYYRRFLKGKYRKRI
ncbi:MAG: polysaccharide biosynthesis C-terminal domain-containing protein [Clostridia bacterium]|nr:polysaccharide biosynthesis C-terminal domain-containing protein [Clostridia bacterium]